MKDRRREKGEERGGERDEKIERIGDVRNEVRKEEYVIKEKTKKSKGKL